MGYLQKTGIWDSVLSRNIPWFAAKCDPFHNSPGFSTQQQQQQQCCLFSSSFPFLSNSSNNKQQQAPFLLLNPRPSSRMPSTLSLLSTSKLEMPSSLWWKDAEQLQQTFSSSDIHSLSATIFQQFYLWLCSQVEFDKELMEAFQKTLCYQAPFLLSSSSFSSSSFSFPFLFAITTQGIRSISPTISSTFIGLIHDSCCLLASSPRRK